MKRSYTPFFIIIVISLLSLSHGCSKDPSSHHTDNNTADTTIPIQWVGTNVVYDSTVVKKNYSLIYFYANWCGYCKQMEANTFKNPEVSNIIYESFNIAKINIDSDTLVDYFDTTVTCHDLAKNIYRISGVPTSCIFGKKGNYIGSVPGYIPPTNFASILEAVRIGAYGE
jgi:thioredoxin 1